MRKNDFVLGLAASPRPQANSTILLDTVLRAAEQQGCRVKKVELFKFNIRSCQGCGGCDHTGECVLNDDMHLFYPLLEEAGHVVLAAPIYFYALSGIAKAFIDRSQALWVRKYRLTQPPPEPQGKGYLIAVGATKGKRLFECSQLTMRYYFDALNINYEREILVKGLDEEGEVFNKKDVLAEADTMGRTMGPNQM